MGFLPNYDNPGPERDLPRKTGIFRLWETLSRDFWDLFRAGFLALLGCAPFLLGVAYSLSAHVLIYAPAAGLLGGAIAGPELCGLADTVLRGLAALAIVSVYLWGMARFYLFLAPLFPVTNLWVPVLPALFLIYPGINEHFRIEEKLKNRPED